MANFNAPSREELQKYSVNRDGWEALRWRFYDSSAYATTGHTQLTYFQLPVGQSSKNYSDTNMNLAGQLPLNQEFLVQSIEVNFLPGLAPSILGADAAQTAINDANIFYKSGNLTFTIGSKSYLQEAPLQSFPPKANFALDSAIATATTAGANLQTRTGYGRAVGRPYMLNPPLYLTSTQNFSVTLNWPEGVQAVTTAGKVFVTLDGILYRRSQ
jgi:hypothetical protein